MQTIPTGQEENGRPIELFYQDWGSGKPLVLIHGWPLSHEMWEHQMLVLPRHGIRVIAYDRRGFGQSSKPWSGYDFDTLADDLKAVLDTLDLQDVTLAGYAMGAGEIARYMSRHGGARVGRIALIAGITPFMLKTSDNPEGIDASRFEGMRNGLEDDRFEWLASVGRRFYGIGLLSQPVSQAALNWTGHMCERASPRATAECAEAVWRTDFRQDIATIKVPTLLVHGDEDDIYPSEATSNRIRKMLPQAVLKRYISAPHGLFLTHKDELSSDLLAFIRKN